MLRFRFALGQVAAVRMLAAPIQPTDPGAPESRLGQLGGNRVKRVEMASHGRPGSSTRHHTPRPASQPSGGQARSVKGLRPDPLRGLTDAPPPLQSRPGRGAAYRSSKPICSEEGSTRSETLSLRASPKRPPRRPSRHQATEQTSQGASRLLPLPTTPNFCAPRPRDRQQHGYATRAPYGRGRSRLLRVFIGGECE
jgi:hypothetical protein